MNKITTLVYDVAAAERPEIKEVIETLNIRFDAEIAFLYPNVYANLKSETLHKQVFADTGLIVVIDNGTMSADEIEFLDGYIKDHNFPTVLMFPRETKMFNALLNLSNPNSVAGFVFKYLQISQELEKGTDSDPDKFMHELENLIKDYSTSCPI